MLGMNVAISMKRRRNIRISAVDKNPAQAASFLSATSTLYPLTSTSSRTLSATLSAIPRHFAI